MEQITEDQMQKLFKYLTGESDDVETQLELTPKQAFGLIYFMQEHLEILPQNYELCESCECLINVDYGGCFADDDAIESDFHFRPEVIEKGGFYCDSCAPHFELTYAERESK